MKIENSRHLFSGVVAVVVTGVVAAVVVGAAVVLGVVTGVVSGVVAGVVPRVVDGTVPSFGTSSTGLSAVESKCGQLRRVHLGIVIERPERTGFLYGS